jgi:hypothetical protein
MAEFSAIQRDAANIVNSEMDGMSRLALTPDGLALRELNRMSLYRCLEGYRRPLSAAERAECAEIENSPALKRLRKAPYGENLIRFSSDAYMTLWAMIQLGHDAGISFEILLPPDQVAAAGLAFPAEPPREETTSPAMEAPSAMSGGFNPSYPARAR